MAEQALMNSWSRHAQRSIPSATGIGPRRGGGGRRNLVVALEQGHFPEDAPTRSEGTRDHHWRRRPRRGDERRTERRAYRPPSGITSSATPCQRTSTTRRPRQSGRVKSFCGIRTIPPGRAFDSCQISGGFRFFQPGRDQTSFDDPLRLGRSEPTDPGQLRFQALMPNNLDSRDGSGQENSPHRE